MSKLVWQQAGNACPHQVGREILRQAALREGIWEERKREQWPRKDGWRQWEEEGGRRWKLRVGSSSAPTAFHARRALPTSHLLACLPTLGDHLLLGVENLSSQVDLVEVGRQLDMKEGSFLGSS